MNKMSSCFALLICLLVTCHVKAIDSIEDGKLLEKLLRVIADRNEKLDDFQAVITRTEKNGKDFDGFWESLADYNMYMSRYMGQPQPRKEPVNKTHTMSAPVRYWRVTQLDQNSIRNEMAEGKANDEFSNIFFSECWNGDYWQAVNNESGNLRVTLSDLSRASNISAVLGLSFPDQWVSNEFLDYLIKEKTVGPDFVIREIKEKENSNNSEILITFTVPDKKVHGLAYRIEVVFASKYGYAPLSASGYWIKVETGKRVDMSRGFDATWSEWSEMDSGVFIAKKLIVDHWGDVLIPKDKSKGFKKLLVDGNPVLENDFPKFDPQSYETKSFQHGFEEFHCVKFEESPSFEGSLCTETFPKGTIVQDDRASEVYRLTNNSPVVGEIEKEILEPAPASVNVPPVNLPEVPNSRSYIWLFSVSIGLVVLLSVYLTIRFVKSRKN